MALHTKCRPKDFDEFVGNIPTINSLKTIVKDPDKPHTYLLIGPPGCGKTTLARILSKYFDAHENDIQEIDIAKNRGIDKAKEIINNVNYKPLYGRTKVYVLDEVHRATKEFQDAMLKTLEEPPEHVFFILCTTDPQMIIPTVMSRCTKYKINLLPPKRIKKLLDTVCEKEKINIEEEAIKKICKVSEGEPRQALIILNKVKNINDEKKIINAIQEFSKTEEKTVIELCQVLLQGKSWNSISKILKGVDAEPERIRKAVLSYMSTVLLNGDNPRAVLIIELFSENYFDSGKAGLILSCYNVSMS